ncbi:hypothetical protein TNCV_2303271 [Trichonephila clavipes]|nr:hypothetical protein TNCV_2303271 [Trichonephila clavipes]
MRARALCAHPSIPDHWALRCMNRCPDPVVSLKRDPQCLSPQESSVLIDRPTAWCPFQNALVKFLPHFETAFPDYQLNRNVSYTCSRKLKNMPKWAEAASTGLTYKNSKRCSRGYVFANNNKCGRERALKEALSSYAIIWDSGGEADWMNNNMKGMLNIRAIMVESEPYLR